MTATAPPFLTGAHAPRVSVSHEFRSVLEQTTIGEVAPNLQTLVTASDRESVGHVFKKMIDNRLLSVPVVNPHEPHNFMGFIDVFDILAFVVTWTNQVPATTRQHNFQQVLGWHANQAMISQPCWTSINKSLQDSPKAFYRNAKLQDVINFMQASNCRRVAIIDQSDRLVSVVTQSFLVRYLANRIKDLGNLGRMTVHQLQLGIRPVRTVQESSRAIDAFMDMWQKGYSGIAVCQQDGSIMGNLSMDDIKDIGYNAQSFEKLLVCCGDFVKSKHYGAEVKAVLSVPSSTSIRDVLKNFVDAHIHRLYVIDQDTHGKNKLVGVISLRDTLQLLVHFHGAGGA